MDYFLVCSVPVMDLSSLIAVVGEVGTVVTGWVLILAVTVLGAVVAHQTLADGRKVALDSDLALPRSPAIGRDRHWAPNIVAAVVINVLLTNCAILLLFVVIL
jgi:hypothetical protein